MISSPGPGPSLPCCSHDNTHEWRTHHVTSNHITGERMVIGAGFFSHCCWNYQSQINNLTKKEGFQSWVIREALRPGLDPVQQGMSTGPDPVQVLVPIQDSIVRILVLVWSRFLELQCEKSRVQSPGTEQTSLVNRFLLTIDPWKTIQDSAINISTSQRTTLHYSF